MRKILKLNIFLLVEKIVRFLVDCGPQIRIALFTNMRILKFRSQPTIAFFAAVNHLNGPLRKQNFTSRVQKVMVCDLWISIRFVCFSGCFPFREKNPEISVGAEVEFLNGKKLFHLVVNPATSQCPTVDLELVQTTRNVNGTRHSVRKFQPGKRAHLFRFSTFSGNFPVGRTDETCSIYRRTGNSENFD